MFAREDYARLPDRLQQLQGHWLLSHNDVLEVRTLFAGCQMEEVRASYSVGTKTGSRALPRGELIISPQRAVNGA